MILVAYIRVSSSSSKFNTSLDDQLKRIQDHCNMMQHDLVKVFAEVKSASGNVERAEFESALAWMVDHNLDGLVVYDLDRYFRDAAGGLMTCKKYFSADTGYTLVSASQNIDTSTDEGYFMFGQLLLFAEMERRKIVRRMNRGKEALRDQGYFPDPKPKFADEVIEITDGHKKRRVVQRSEVFGAISDDVTALRDSGMGWTDIAALLNNAGKRDKYGKEFRPYQICRIYAQALETRGQMVAV